MENRVSCTISIDEELVIDVSQVLSVGYHRKDKTITIVLNAFETRLFAKTDVPLRPSKTTYNTSTTSCWELKSNGTLQISDILRTQKKMAHIKFMRP